MNHNKISGALLMISIGFLIGIFSSVLAILYPNVRYMGLGVPLAFLISLVGFLLFFFKELKKYKK